MMIKTNCCFYRVISHENVSGCFPANHEDLKNFFNNFFPKVSCKETVKRILRLRNCYNTLLSL